MFWCLSFVGKTMLSNRKLFASALLNKIIYVTKFTYFYIKLPLFMLQNVEGGGGACPSSRCWSAFREIHVDKQKLSQVQSCQRMTSHHLLPAVMSNLRHASKFSPTCCKVYKINRLGACCFNKHVMTHVFR